MNDNLKMPPTLTQLHARRTEILALAEKHGAYNIRIFGSVAHNKITPDSDVDFLVSWDYDRISSWGGVGLDLALEELLGCKVDIISEAGLSPLLKEQILEEAVPL